MHQSTKIFFGFFICVSIHCYTQNQIQNFGIQYFEIGEYIKAAREFEKILPISKTEFGESSEEYANTLYLIALSFENGKFLIDAQNYYARALMIYDTINLRRKNKIDYTKLLNKYT